MTKIAKIFCILWLAGAFCAVAQAQRLGYVISPTNGESVLYETSLRHTVRALTDSIAEGRATGTEGGLQAARWLENQFREIGLKPLAGRGFRQLIRTDNGSEGQNLIALVPGQDTLKKYVVVMAHYDNLGVLSGTLYPGADSNASGVAALLEVARMFVRMHDAGKAYDQRLLIVALDGKEQNLSGSRQLLKSLQSGSLKNPDSGAPITLADISLVVNLDQLGSTLAPVKENHLNYLLMLSEEATGRRKSAESVNRLRHLGLELTFDYYGSKDFTRLFYRRISDQCPFMEVGVPAVMFTSGITLNNNKPYDDAASLDYAMLLRRVRLIYYYLERLL